LQFLTNLADAAYQLRETRFAESLLNGVVRSVGDSAIMSSIFSKSAFSTFRDIRLVIEVRPQRSDRASGLARQAGGEGLELRETVGIDGADAPGGAGDERFRQNDLSWEASVHCQY